MDRVLGELAEVSNVDAGRRHRCTGDAYAARPVSAVAVASPRGSVCSRGLQPRASMADVEPSATPSVCEAGRVTDEDLPRLLQRRRSARAAGPKGRPLAVQSLFRAGTGIVDHGAEPPKGTWQHGPGALAPGGRMQQERELTARLPLGRRCAATAPRTCSQEVIAERGLETDPQGARLCAGSPGL